MAPKFGTSGLRGLVTELTDDVVADYTRAFLASCPTGGRVFVGWDLRPSSPRIAAAVTAAAGAMGLPVTRCGALPTPALALAAMEAGACAVMITGSHIPADRNGLKFYLPTGEISKADEARISAALGPGSGTTPGTPPETAPETAPEVTDTDEAAGDYVARYATAFGASALGGLKIGVYQHSSVARDIMVQAVEALGGMAVALAPSDTFVPVDTEAVDPDTRGMLNAWCREHGLDAVISTDGDADRPMVTDATGRIVPGDVLGPLTAGFLGAEVICTPVSSNTAVDGMGFSRVLRTRIGSPYVIAAMEDLAGQKVVGYEANGGFLLGFAAAAPAGPLAPLMTRDSLLPILAPLARARAEGRTLADLVATLPARFTAADRVAGIEPEDSAAFLDGLRGDAAARAAFFDTGSDEAEVDETDGLRVTFATGDIVHLRPSGNAPEFRCYAEADSPERAEELLQTHLAKLTERLG
ncbi:phosphomannomutase [Psychromarinibacter sp. C21-152]|uniref:Phosphomannomutase n=1 Tax=Psychromarinibacter sediminicola TaxID=3033385 RepID=A0AAE3NQI6_9RHOB|nr:phosphomannomutase [Psychromarinibacter sediminicola]MDF0601678.1 phosphomannomutase [Psychromarinibacter sediminicola]